MTQLAEAVGFKSSADLSTAYIKESIVNHLHYTLAKDKYTATRRDCYEAVALAVRDRLIGQWIKTQQRYYDEDKKRVYYLSMEFLIGRTLGNALVNLNIRSACEQALAEYGLTLDELISEEWDAGLGNGGLGRLAACFLDSMATLGLPAYGYGVRYEYGIFAQKIENGHQVETPDNWLRYGNPWEIGRPENLYPVHFYGSIHQYIDANGDFHCEWTGSEVVMAMAYDIPVPGYSNGTVNTLRLWSAKSSRGFDLGYFNRGDYITAVEEKNRSENISRVLYPNDNFFLGQELRLKQEYFLVSATLQDIVRRYKKTHDEFDQFAQKVAIQLNDTHPAMAIAELMRILVDLERVPWDIAWRTTVAVFGYTNHTLLPEALEKWPVSMVGHLLPRHLQIIFEINHRFMKAVAHLHPGDDAKLQRMSLIEEGPEKRVRMANLAALGSHSVNGVSALHSQLLRDNLFRDFDQMFPGRFNNKTNGITPRRWLMTANPRLSALISSSIGPSWAVDLMGLEQIVPLAEDADFRAEWGRIKRDNKRRLADYVLAEQNLHLNVDSIFDCQVKRIHEYKRQLLNILHVITLYNAIRQSPSPAFVPRTFIFGGKAAPGYSIAKSIIRLINAVADVVNYDPAIGERLKVVFLANYSVSLAEKIMPAADVSEQISTAGTEASGTGNMKFALNGALTIGTLDGANVEIKEAVGDDNIFIFGLTAEEVVATRTRGYDPGAVCAADARLKQAFDMIRSGFFSPAHPAEFSNLLASLFDGRDHYLVLADFASYAETQKRVAQTYLDQETWTRMSIKNVAHVGRFSSDRTIAEYARDIWGIEP